MEPLRILVVDDHQNVRQGIRALLSFHAGWLICGEAEDGVDALDKARQLRPDVILMDVTMPRMGGIEATRILSRELPEVKVVIVSQNDRAVVSRQAKDAGAAAHVAKSDMAVELTSVIDGLCCRQQLKSNPHASDASGADRTAQPVSSDHSHGNTSVPVEAILRTEELRLRVPRSPD